MVGVTYSRIVVLYYSIVTLTRFHRKLLQQPLSFDDIDTMFQTALTSILLGKQVGHNEQSDMSQTQSDEQADAPVTECTKVQS